MAERTINVKISDAATLAALDYLENDAPGRVNLSEAARQGIRDEAARRRATGAEAQTNDSDDDII